MTRKWPWLVVGGLLCGALAAIGLRPAYAAPVTLEVFASSTPNGFGSPSWNPYVGNALNALENGLSNVGDRDTDPTAYERLGGSFTPGDMMVTSFNSWRGQANPPVPFDNELGNRLHFGLHAYGDGVVMLKLVDLTFSVDSSDGGDNVSGFGGSGVLGFSGDFVGLDFNCSTRYGIHWGADRAKGGADDTQVCGAGSGEVLVDEFVYVGVGNALWPGGPGDPLTGQPAIDATFDYINDNIASVTGSYCIDAGGSHYCGQATVYQAPEPPFAAVALLASGGLYLMRRRRRSIG